MDIFIPDHIWLDIFKHVSPLKLLILRRTCKSFKNIIEEIFEKNNKWKDLCLNSSIKPWIWNIQEKLFPYAEKYTPEELEGNMFLALTNSSGNLSLFNIDSKTIFDDLFINAWTRSQTLSRGTDHKLMIGSAVNVIYQLSWNETPEIINIKPINIGNAYEDLWWPVKSLCCQYEKTTLAVKYQFTSRVSFDNGDLKITKRMDPNFDPPPKKIYIPIPEVVIFNEGSVYLFMLKDIQQLVDENLSQLPIAKVLPISNEPILTLNITEVKKEPYIIAFTKSNLHVVKL
ncbi:hypothetical protein G9C98_003971 [Cotesia typhae]|uniref:F-box domain-containing protein n=1 Tax=Cotesia typhae TaxID=2053667 RepID=A0A8J5V7C0_9HYME|nr:hypothetical protein G9C98_003971 [Cotesia typhae]